MASFTVAQPTLWQFVQNCPQFCNLGCDRTNLSFGSAKQNLIQFVVEFRRSRWVIEVCRTPAFKHQLLRVEETLGGALFSKSDAVSERLGANLVAVCSRFCALPYSVPTNFRDCRGSLFQCTPLELCHKVLSEPKIACQCLIATNVVKIVSQTARCILFEDVSHPSLESCNPSQLGVQTS